MNKISILFFFSFLAFSLQNSCSTTIAGNENGSEPINEQESVMYRQEILKCYKTGGTRIVKIQGKLRCFN